MALTAVLALVLGLIQLGERSLANDEGVSAEIGHRHMSSLLYYVHYVEPNNILYFGFLHFWEKLGSSDAFLRVPSLTAFPVAVAFTAAIAWRSFGRAAGVVAGLLLALNALALHHAQNARAYSWLMALVAASTLCFILAVERPTARRWAIWVAVSALAAYAHPFALFVVAAQAISLAWLPSSRIPWRKAAVAAAPLTVVVAPLIVLLATGNTSRIDWVQPLEAGRVWNVLEEVAGAENHPLLLELYLCLGLVLLVGALMMRPRRGEAAWRTLLAVLCFAVPVVLVGLFSVVQPAFLAYYLIVAVPGLAVMAAGALARIPLPLAVAALVALCLVHTRGLSDWYRGQGPDFRGAAAVLRAHARWEDAIVSDPGGNSTVAWYLGRTPNVPGPGAEWRARSIDDEAELLSFHRMPRVWLVQAAPGNRFDNRVPLRALGRRRVLRVWNLHNVRVALLGRPLAAGEN
ncbi:MAG TPA: glycosyltransferase family 39 protein [Thermoleophilaceae bacterium]